MQYAILSAQGNRGIETLETAVKGYLADGWQPTGGICATTHQGSGTVSYYQAMVKYDAVVRELETEAPAPAPEMGLTFAVPDLSETATPGAVEFAAATLGEDYESILLDLHAHLGRKVNKADVREIAPVEEVIHAD